MWLELEGADQQPIVIPSRICAPDAAAALATADSFAALGGGGLSERSLEARGAYEYARRIDARVATYFHDEPPATRPRATWRLSASQTERRLLSAQFASLGAKKCALRVLVAQFLAS